MEGPSVAQSEECVNQTGYSTCKLREELMKVTLFMTPFRVMRFKLEKDKNQALIFQENSIGML